MILFLCLALPATGQVSVVDTIDVEFVAGGIDVNPVTNRVYISNGYFIMEIAGASGAIIDSLWGPTIGGLHDLAVR